MSSLTTIQPTDIIANSRTDINTNFSNLNTDKIETSVIDTDTSLAANSDAKIATQKAVKAYVDAGGNVNASETTKGIVEEATDAEVTAGTATGATGAKLFMTPAKFVTRMATIVLNAATQLTGIIPAANLPLPAFNQNISANSTSPNQPFGSNTDGSVVVVVGVSASVIKRYARDTVTGAYVKTHVVNATSLSASPMVSVVVLGSYVYVFYDAGTNVGCFRYLLADLTGEQAMTVPTVAATGSAYVTAWTDGTFVYVISSTANTTVNKWSLSGTTFSAAGTATAAVSTMGDANWLRGNAFDGTTPYLINSGNTGSNVTIYKLTTVDGSVVTTTTKILDAVADETLSQMFPAIIPIDSQRMYIGREFPIYNPTTIANYSMPLIPITKP